MMKYEEFKEAFLTDFKKYLPEEYRDVILSIEPVIQINTVMDGVSLDCIVDGIHVHITFCLKKIYEKYLITENLQKVFEVAAIGIVQAVSENSEKSKSLDLKNAKENIVFQVVNTLQNETLLKNIPHREFLDLSIIYRRVFQIDDENITSSIITNSFSKELGLNEEELFQYALVNTRRLLPPTILSADDAPLWCISNSLYINGAVNMLYEDILHKLATQIESDLYILPSSVHECMVTPANIDVPYNLADMVREINLTEVAIEDRLSNLVYHYSRTTRKLTIAVDNPNRSLDDIGTGTSLM